MRSDAEVCLQKMVTSPVWQRCVVRKSRTMPVSSVKPRPDVLMENLCCACCIKPEDLSCVGVEDGREPQRPQVPLMKDSADAALVEVGRKCSWRTTLKGRLEMRGAATTAPLQRD